MIMKTQHKSTYLLIGAILLTLALVMGCVDVPTEGPTPTPLRSEYRFIHAATDMGNVSLTVQGKAAGSVDFKGSIAHADYGSGTKELLLSNGDYLLISLSTDYRGTFVLLNKEGVDRTYLKLTERRIFDSATIVDTVSVGAIRPVHCSADAGAADIYVDGPGGSFSWKNVAYRGIGAYQKVTPGDYTVTVKAAGGADALYTTTVAVGTERNTVIVMGSAAGGTLTAVGVKDN
ncbi:MAG TPA: DUF4397 domain-containing protein [bacterium]|nr:DUF4397 domain-containing protein [bacterium]